MEFLGAAQRLVCLADTSMGPQRLQVQLANSEGQDWRTGMMCSLHWPANAMQLFYRKTA